MAGTISGRPTYACERMKCLKRILYIMSALLLAVLTAACASAEKQTGGLSETQQAVTVAETGEIGRIAENMLTANQDDGHAAYTFEFCNYGDKYIVTAIPENRNVRLVVEDKEFNAKEMIITPPEGYVIDIPHHREDAPYYYIIVNRMYETGAIPQLLRIDFYNPDAYSGDDEAFFSRYYAIRKDMLEEVPLYEATPTASGAEAVRRSEGRAEPYSLMPEALVMMNRSTAEDGSLLLETCRFEPEKFRLVKKKGIETPDDPLCFGYYKYYRAEEMYKLLFMSNFGCDPSEAIAEKKENEGFCPAHDEKYPDLQSVIDAASEVFTDEYLEKTDAFARFRDVDGALWVRPFEGEVPDSYGNIIIVMQSESEDKKKYMTVTEKYEDGKSAGYYPLSDFELEKVDGNWKASAMTYPQ